MNNKKPLVIYHDNCVDGFSAAWCFWHALPNAFEFHPGVYNQAPPDVFGRRVFLLDFSYKRSVVEEMLFSAESVTFLDHHKSAVEDLEGMEWSHSNFINKSDLNRSGAMIAWDFICDNMLWERPAPLLLQYIQYRDLGHMWRTREELKEMGIAYIPQVEEVTANLFSYEMTFDNWESLMAMNEADIIDFANGGEVLLRKFKKDLKLFIKQMARKTVIGGYTVPVANLPGTFASDAGNMMAQGNHFAATYYDTERHRVFSLRSADGLIDVSEVAQRYGGGGHPRAAGFKVPRDHYLATF